MRLLRYARNDVLFPLPLVLALFSLGGCTGQVSAPDKNELVLWHWMTDREAALQTLVDNYTKATGVSVRLELYAPSDSYASKIRASAQTNTLPDIFGVLGESRDLASFIKSGHIANLTEAMNAPPPTPSPSRGEGPPRNNLLSTWAGPVRGGRGKGGGGKQQVWKEQFFPKALATNTFARGNAYEVEPGIYGVPIDVTNIQWLYNKALFRKAGLNPEKPPRTWKEFLETNRALKAAGIPGLASGWGETWLIHCFANNYAFNIMGEQKVLDTYRGKVPYTDPGWLKVFELFDTLRREDALVKGMVTMVNKTAEQAFANERAAFAFNGSWCVNVYRGMNPRLDYGVLLPPKISEGHPMRIWGGAGSSFMVNAKSSKREQAIQFLRWLTGPAQQARLSRETLNLPANQESLTDIPAVLAGFARGMDSTTHPTQWPLNENPSVVETFTKNIQSILIGEKTPRQAAEEAQAVKEREKHRT